MKLTQFDPRTKPATPFPPGVQAQAHSVRGHEAQGARHRDRGAGLCSAARRGDGAVRRLRCPGQARPVGRRGEVSISSALDGGAAAASSPSVKACRGKPGPAPGCARACPGMPRPAPAYGRPAR
eukprot:363322-Chlamydomonas_euryale.AAC.1